MKIGRMGARVARAVCVLLAAAIVQGPVAALASQPENAAAYTYGERQSCDYILNSIVPTYQRQLPISEDDPLRGAVSDDAVIQYEYGCVFNDVNDYYFYNQVTGEWKGNQSVMDTGVLVGGNASSEHDGARLDDDYNDFNRILPYGSIYIDGQGMSMKSVKVEYEFFSDAFNFNSSSGRIPRKTKILGDNVKLTRYQQRFSVFSAPRNRDYGKLLAWNGVVYTGGVQKTVRNADGSFTETVVRNEDENGNSKLFTVRYKDVAEDRDGQRFDLVLTFTQITFVAEADVTGAFGIMDGNKLNVAPVLCERGRYVVVIDDPSSTPNKHGLDGVRIGARYEFDYSVETADGVPAEGLILYSVNDLDNASMATSPQTDANWGSNALGFDFGWAEGFGVVSGAASYAVLPYYNHAILDAKNRPIKSYNGDSTLLRVSRMGGAASDGTANGLYFTTSITSPFEKGVRNDGNTPDTGAAMLLYPQGSMVSAISSGRRGNVNIALFDPAVSHKIKQGCSSGGDIYSEDYSFKQGGARVENRDSLKVVGGGVRSVHYFKPDEGHQIFRIRIDDRSIPYDSLQWTEQADGTRTASYDILETYGKTEGEATYQFTRDKDGLVWFAFDNIQDNHEVYVVFIRLGFLGLIDSLRIYTGSAVFLAVGFLLLMLTATIFWKVKGKKRYNEISIRLESIEH